MMRLSRLALYARTARELQPVQWLYLPLRRLQGPPRVRTVYPDATVDSAALAAFRQVMLRWPHQPAEHFATAEAVLGGEFRFLNHSERIQHPDWSHRYVSHLWSYNLHYFDYGVDLAVAYLQTRRTEFLSRLEQLVTSWIAGTRELSGDGWQPYAISVRIPNWIQVFTLLAGDLRAEVRDAMVGSLYAQATALERRLELHLQANHLLRNYYALAWAGLFLRGRRADRWRRRAVVAYWRELSRQVLPDGGHFERSPMYHALVLADSLRLLDLCRATGAPVPEHGQGAVRRLLDAFLVLSRADGSLHLFNDSANGIAPARAELVALAAHTLGEDVVDSAPGHFALSHTGYFGVRDDSTRSSLIVDCGEPGPSFQPGHAHCDMLSYELDIDGRPVVVDSGVRGYEGDPLREYVRSTRAHNTVSIGGREQSEVWATYRMARRARIDHREWRKTPTGAIFAGAYRPWYDRRVRHHRTIEAVGCRWNITDRIEGALGASLASFIHLHPDFRIELRGQRILAESPQLAVWIEPFGVDTVRVLRGESDPVQGWYCPEFGTAVPAPVVELGVESNRGLPIGYTILPVGRG